MTSAAGPGDVPASSATEARDRPTRFVESVIADLEPALRDKLLDIRTYQRQTGLYVIRELAHPLLRHLRDRHDFEVLVDVTAVDYLNKDTRERFQVVYVVQNRRQMELLRVHAWVPEEDPSIATVHDLWPAARWGERECHDMFGIEFAGAPDLRRFLMPEDYPGFPLLKDYPLKGKGERVQFPTVVPCGDEMKVEKLPKYPTTIGRGLHTPEYLKEIERDSKPRA